MTKGYVPNWSEEMFVIVKTTVRWLYDISDRNDEEMVGTFYEKELKKKKTNQKDNKVVKSKSNKLYVNEKSTIIVR